MLALLDYDVALVAFDDVLDLGQLVTVEHEEPPAVAANRLVLGLAQQHDRITTQPRALAAKPDLPPGRIAGMAPFDPLVEPAITRLVMGQPFLHLGRLRHAPKLTIHAAVQDTADVAGGLRRARACAGRATDPGTEPRPPAYGR